MSETSNTSKRFPNPIFASRFKGLLKETNDQALAEYLGIQSTSTFRQWANGYTLPTCENLLKLSDYYGVTCDFLLGSADCTTADNEAIRKSLALTDKAIDAIKHVGAVSKDHRYIEVLNAVLESESFGSLLHCLYRCLGSKLYLTAGENSGRTQEAFELIAGITAENAEDAHSLKAFEIVKAIMKEYLALPNPIATKAIKDEHVVVDWAVSLRKEGVSNADT